MGDVTRNMAAGLKRHIPELCIGIGISGWCTATVLAVRATPKAMEEIEAYKKRYKLKKLTPLQALKVAWKCYIPSFATGACSTACIIGANTVHRNRNAAIATAYAISEGTLRSLKEKTIEVIGEKKAKEIQDAVVKERMERRPPNMNEVIITDKGNVLCYDCAFGRTFYTDYNALRAAENEINRRLVNEMYVSLNDFYDQLEVGPIDIGHDLGWNMENGFMELFISTQLAPDGKTPCLAINYNIVPQYNYSKLRY